MRSDDGARRCSDLEADIHGAPRAEPGLDEGLQLGAAQITLNEIADASRMPFGGS